MCDKENTHVHTFSDTEYAINSEGHWKKATCGHDYYISELIPRVDTDTDDVCDTCNVSLKYDVNVVITQPDRVTLDGDAEYTVNIGDDLTITVLVNSRFALFVTTGGGEIVGEPTIEAGIATYTV